MLPKTIQKSGEEILYTNENLRYYISHCPDKSKHNTDNIMHWHYDFEFTVVLEGEYPIEFGGKKYIVKKGDGLFINTCVLHSAVAEGCDIVVVRIHPSLLCTNEYLWKTFVSPLLNGTEFSGMILHYDIPWQNKINEIILEINRRNELGIKSLPFYIQQSILQIWNLFYDNVSIKGDFVFESDQITDIKTMMDYIERNYMNPITLKDIANYKNISIRTCNSIFQKYIHTSPMQYLIEYRLMKSKQLLEESDLNMTEIANRCGFHSSSYFTEMFKKQYGITPRQYKKEPKF